VSDPTTAEGRLFVAFARSDEDRDRRKRIAVAIETEALATPAPLDADDWPPPGVHRHGDGCGHLRPTPWSPR